jgi:hypothetical protein
MNRKLLFFRASLAFISIAITFAFLEFVAPLYFSTSRLIYKHYENRPSTYYPNFPLRFVTADIDVYFKTNSLGFKDYEHLLQPSKPTFRVLLLGDSYVQANTVSIEEQTSRVMERIAENKGISLEVISMGMSGYGQTHHLQNYNTIGRQFKPNLVITTFCSNDMWNNLEKTNSDPFHVLKGEQLLLRSRNPRPPLSRSKKLLRSTIQKTETYFIFRDIITRIIRLFDASAFKYEAAVTAARMKAVIGKTAPPKVSHKEASEKYLSLMKAAVAKIAPPKVSGKETSEAHLRRVIATKPERKTFIALVKELENVIYKKDGVPLLHSIVSSLITKEISPDYLYYLDWTENVLGSYSGGRPAIDFHKDFTELFNKTGLKVHYQNDSHWNSLGHELVAQKFIEHIQMNFNMASYKTKKL